jgi:hypothetical protein
VIDPLILEVLPEERLAKLVGVLIMDPKFMEFTLTEMAAALSPYLQLEILEAKHEERVLCLSDFYNLREKLMVRERESFQKMSELTAQILARPEALALGIRRPENSIPKK